jgi:uncharacterized protein (UPF0371 family)
MVKNILGIRRMLADIHYIRVMAITAVDERDKITLLNKLKEMRRKIAALESMLETEGG